MLKTTFEIKSNRFIDNVKYFTIWIKVIFN